MKKKNQVNKVLTIVMVLLLAVSVSLESVIPVFAIKPKNSRGMIMTSMTRDEIDGNAEQQESGEQSGGEQSDRPKLGEGYEIELDTYRVSLGTIDRGSDCPCVPITVSNRSNRAVVLIWQESDPNQIFNIEAPSDNYVPVGQSASFHVKANTSAGAGSYTGTFLVADESDPGFTNGKRVELSVTIFEAAPYVTRVTVSPGSANVATGSGMQFNAIVEGGNNPDTSVSWSISGNGNSGTSIDSNGYLRVDSNETSKNIRVTATSNQNPQVSGGSDVSVIDSDHTLTVVADPSEGGNVSGGGAIAHGGSMTVLAAPNISYNFVGWYLNGSQVSTQAKYTQTNITSDMTLVAKFSKNECYVNVDADHREAGDITRSQFVRYGDSLTLNASVRSGWKFDGWCENNSIISRDTKFELKNITSDRKITAIFSKNSYNVSLSINPSDCGKVKGAGSYTAGTDVTVEAEAYDGYTFKNWTLNGSVVGTDTKLYIKGIGQDYSLIANFEKKGVPTYKITAGVCSNDGVISPNGTIAVQQGSSVLYTITPNNGYKILAVAVDGVQVGPVTSYSFVNVNGNHSISAAFAPRDNVGPVPNNPTSNKDQIKTDTLTPEEFNDSNSQPIVDDISGDAIAVEDEYEYDSQMGVLQEKNLTLDEAMEARGEDAKELMMSAVYQGLLQVAVYDEYDADGSKGASGDFINSRAFPNLEQVVDSVLTPEEIGEILSGNPVKINVNIFDNSTYISDVEKNAINEYVSDKEVGNYFEILMLKSKNGNCESITNLNVGMKICIDVPSNLREAGRDFYVVRSHMMDDGSLQMTLLNDEDSNPDTITFTTDRFSAYGIAYDSVKEDENSKWIIVVLLGVVAALSTALILVIATEVSRRKRRRHRR